MSIATSLTKSFVNSIGQWSDGIRLCTKEGLTSGLMLDYIYENRPRGRFLIGKLIDRFFIRHPGWEGTRLRREHVESLLEQAISSLALNEDPIHILDIASGPASYVLNVLSKTPNERVSARCQDIDERWLTYAQEKAAAAHLKNVSFGVQDAFDGDALKALDPQPNIILSSGFYDWIQEDEQVKSSIQMCYDTLPEGGYFITTNQMAHPNQQFVESVFSDFNSSPLRMKMRPEATLKTWLEAAGFEVKETKADRFGYYGVLMAYKPENV